MWLKLIHRIATWLPSREIIRENGDQYLTRYAFFGFMPHTKKSRLPISLYLHHFHRPDADDAPHNHPWKWSCSFALYGGYLEFRLKRGFIEKLTVIKTLSFNWISHSDYHLITKLYGKETWTLFLAGPRISSWGFLERHGRGHVEWRQWLMEKGLQVPY